MYRCEVFGNTYEVRDKLKRLGFRFNPDHKSWVNEPLDEREKEILENTSLFDNLHVSYEELTPTFPKIK